MNRYWFKPKRYGLGASPSSWEGWAVTFGYVALVLGMTEWYRRHGHLPDANYFIGVALLTITLVCVAWLKTEGGWSWRWGKKR